ncbi:hypothetical protein GCM10007362_29470 [Saccharibacillus endophyticus]|uniref:Peptide-methionine (S)-S-oxide reductase n=1 Tax=Saccharibacillus endophyticus TaxID=2060666 RepID=A0ABQ1ZX02_9BACL|nr:hypothetical protein GCM10007362_29470 [Saccharibacillus endophyticus]
MCAITKSSADFLNCFWNSQAYVEKPVLYLISSMNRLYLRGMGTQLESGDNVKPDKVVKCARL